MAVKKIINQTETISAQNTFSNEIRARGTFTISITAPGATVVTLQRSFDGSTWLDVESFTEQTEKNVTEVVNGVLYRLGVKTGDYDTTSPDVGIYQ